MRRILAIILAMSLLLAGCGARTYVDISPHIEAAAVAPNTSGDLTASNYAELKAAILYLVERSQEEGVITLAGYSGNADADLRRACSEVTNDEPLGAYGVEYMSCSGVKVLANYNASVSITYSRTPKEMNAIRHVSGAEEFADALTTAIKNSQTTLVVETPYYSAERYDANLLIERILRQNPLFSISSPTVTQSLYPSTGLRRIVELNIDYGVDGKELNTRRQELESAARSLSLYGATEDETDIDKVQRLVRNVCGRSDFLAEKEDDLTGDVSRDITFTAYGALVDGEASSEGYAMAMSALCSMSGVECKVVSGRWDAIYHCWNLVRVGDSWYHVDAALCELYGEDDYLLKTDAEIGSELKWNAASYPAADGQPITFITDTPETLSEQPDDAGN